MGEVGLKVGVPQIFVSFGGVGGGYSCLFRGRITELRFVAKIFFYVSKSKTHSSLPDVTPS